MAQLDFARQEFSLFSVERAEHLSSTCTAGAEGRQV